jgi:hypothetical protein
MAGYLYPKFKQELLGGTHNLPSDTVYAVLTSTAYNSAHTVVGSLTYPMVVKTMGTKTVTNGVFDAADCVFSSVPAAGTALVAVAIYKGSGGTVGRLVAWCGFQTSVTPNGGNITVTWDSGANKIFAL